MLFILATLAFSGNRLLEGERDFTGYLHANFMSEFKRVYATKEEQLYREAVFLENLALVKQHNADPAKTWFATVNEFADWTNAEFRARRTGVKKAPAQPLALATPLATRQLPAAVDWREHAGVLTPVKNQGGCGSCWAFSAVETFESRLAITSGEPAPVLSEQQVVSCSPDPQHCGGSGGCDGSTQPLAFNYTMSVGLSTEASYPYKGVTGTCEPSKLAPVAINKGYVKLPTNNYTALVAAVASGPVAISVAAGGLGWQLYGGGVYGGGLLGCGYDMDHGVQLVGYGTTAGKDYWIVRNSWGAGWGESGFIRIKRFGEGKEPCGMDKSPQDGDACAGDTKPIQYCGMCAILSSSSYPTGLSKL